MKSFVLFIAFYLFSYCGNAQLISNKKVIEQSLPDTSSQSVLPRSNTFLISNEKNSRIESKQENFSIKKEEESINSVNISVKKNPK